jgi:hypothetical protein
MYFDMDRKEEAIYQENKDNIAKLIRAYSSFLWMTPKIVVDVGAGVGHMRRAIQRHWRGVSYVGYDVSREMCQRFGWEFFDVTLKKHAKHPAFLNNVVICDSVFQYLTDEECERGAQTLRASTRHFLYFDSFTLEESRDPSFGPHNADYDVNLRPRQWYVDLLKRSGFEWAGACCWLPVVEPDTGTPLNRKFTIPSFACPL